MGEETEKRGKVYNIIDSVKGGSGKTTFSIMLSLLLDNKLTELRNNNETSTCLIDMDIQGSALLYLLYGKSYLDGESDKKKEDRIKFLNERVIAVGEENGLKENYANSFCFKDKASSGPRTDVIFGDPRTESKKKFRSMSNQNYSPEVLYSTYRMGLANMLANLKGTEKYAYRQVIFDMPPNADGYSDAVYDVILKKDYSVMKKYDKCNLFLISTLDTGQRLATLDYFFELAASENFQKVNKIFFVFNDWCGFKEVVKKSPQPDSIDASVTSTSEKDDIGLFVEAVSFVKEQIGKSVMTCKQEVEDKIVFVGLKFNIPYYRECTQQDGIQNINTPEGFLDPIKYIADMTTDLKNTEYQDTTERLMQLLDSKDK